MKKFLLIAMALTFGINTHATDGDKFTADNLKYEVTSEKDLVVSLVGYVNAPAGDLDIPQYVTNGNYRYEVTAIGRAAFPVCRNLTSVIIPNSVTSIGNDAFYGCTGLTSVYIPNSVTSIEAYAFNGCTGLTSISIPNSVTSIPELVFNGCTGLTSVIISNSVTKIGAYTFAGCSGIRTIISLPTTPPTLKNKTTFGGVPADAIVYIPKGTYSLYSNAPYWSSFTDFREIESIVIVLNKTDISISEGETYDLIAEIIKGDDIEIVSQSWSSSNPEVVAVNETGRISAVSQGSAIVTLTVVDNHGDEYTAQCEVTITPDSGIDDVVPARNYFSVEYYRLNGIRTNDSILTPGLYVKRQGSTVEKILVK